MRALILDSEAISRLARSHDGDDDPGAIRAAIRAAIHSDSDVVVPAAVLAEQYRGGRHDQVIDACLSRYSAIEVADTTRGLARSVGNILARGKRGSADHVDATVVAVAARVGGGVILTSDPDDIGHLTSGLVGIEVCGL